MGLLFDSIKRFFTKGRNLPLIDPQISTPIAVDWEQYERDERQEHSEMDEFFDAVDEYISRGGTMIFKQSKAPAVLVAVGFGKEYNNKLTVRKNKSQKRNWKHWKRR